MAAGPGQSKLAFALFGPFLPDRDFSRRAGARGVVSRPRAAGGAIRRPRKLSGGRWGSRTTFTPFLRSLAGQRPHTRSPPLNERPIRTVSSAINALGAVVHSALRAAICAASRAISRAVRSGSSSPATSLPYPQSFPSLLAPRPAFRSPGSTAAVARAGRGWCRHKTRQRGRARPERPPSSRNAWRRPAAAPARCGRSLPAARHPGAGPVPLPAVASRRGTLPGRPRLSHAASEAPDLDAGGRERMELRVPGRRPAQ